MKKKIHLVLILLFLIGGGGFTLFYTNFYSSDYRLVELTTSVGTSADAVFIYDIGEIIPEPIWNVNVRAAKFSSLGNLSLFITTESDSAAIIAGSSDMTFWDDAYEPEGMLSDIIVSTAGGETHYRVLLLGRSENKVWNTVDVKVSISISYEIELGSYSLIRYWAFLFCGLAIGLGLGMLLIYPRKKKEQNSLIPSNTLVDATVKPQTKFCKHCGSKQAIDAKFCESCGGEMK
jgi:hypothetical protein